VSTANVNSNLVWLYYGVLTMALAIKSHYRKLSNFMAEVRISAFLERSKSEASRLFSVVPRKWLFIPLFLIAFLASFSAASLPDSQLHVTALDMGGGQNILIDGGPGPQIIAQRLSEKMPFWDKTLDLVVLTQPAADHLTGLVEVLKRYQVKQVLALNFDSRTAIFREWLDLIRANAVPFTTAESGQKVKLPDGAQLEVLNAPEQYTSPAVAGINGLALRLSYINFSFLVAADMDNDAESALVRQRVDLGSTVLKVANHGAPTSTSPAFLKAVKPQIAVISTGSNETSNNPLSEVIDRLNQLPGKEPKLYRTDQSGSVEFITDGEHLRIKTDRD
jgi:competence protein ComEC